MITIKCNVVLCGVVDAGMLQLDTGVNTGV